jgi:hypothetical protein
MDPEREQWLLEQLVIRWGDDAKSSPPRDELLRFYMRRVGNRAGWQVLASRIEATRLMLERRLRDNPSAPPTPEPPPRIRRKRNVSPLVEAEMRAMPPQKLAEMTNADMMECFGASLPTVRRARRKVLGERGEKN